MYISSLSPTKKIYHSPDHLKVMFWKNIFAHTLNVNSEHCFIVYALN